MKLNADVVIVGSGVAGLFSALNLPEEQEIIQLPNQIWKAVILSLRKGESVY
mgnify:CR=1 FL=1